MDLLGDLIVVAFYVGLISSPVWVGCGAGKIADLYRRSKASAVVVVLLVAAVAALLGLETLKAMAGSILL